MNTQQTLLPTCAAVDELIDTLKHFRTMGGSVDEIADVLIDRLKAGSKILTCGNGGSAADALHMSEELMGRYKKDRQSLPAVSLAADPTLMTCIGNDYGFDRVFSRQIEGLGQAGDILVIFSSSGNSVNLLIALEEAKAKGLISIALLGKDGGLLRGKTDHEIIVPSNETARVQEIHTLIMHSWLEQVDSAFA